MQKSLPLKEAAEKSEQEVVMDYYSSQINKLIQELSGLPGIGAKSAQRLAFHILNMPVEQVEGLSEAIINARKNVRYCKECFTLTDDELCPICKDASRNHKTIMVVENTRDLAAYEKTQKYDGSTMCFTVRSHRCLESDQMISTERADASVTAGCG